MLRTVGQEVTLEICRPPPGTMGDGEDLPDGGNTLGVVSTSLTTPNTSHNYLSPSPSFSSCGVRCPIKVELLYMTMKIQSFLILSFPLSAFRLIDLIGGISGFRSSRCS